jgi:flagellar motor protein MotB
MAVFTIDALIKASAQIGDLPVTIIAIVDETKGADALVASKKLFPNIDSLNDPATRIICTADSPSETLARVMMAHFELNQLSNASFEFVNGAEEVWNVYKRTGASEKKVFAVWEPYVSKMLDNPEYHTLVDSSKFRGYIVDVIVVQRSFLLKNEEAVEAVVKSYFTTVFKNRNNMSALIAEDAKQLGQPLKPEQVERLVKTIWWKNTQENYGHFGLTSGHGLQHIESVCINITNVLTKTGAIAKDPSNGQPNLWYYDGIMRKLYDTGWYPGFGQESVREEKSLLSLTDEEWQKLQPVGTLQVPRLVFARGTSRLTDLSFQILDELVESLKTWPQYYLVVRGNATGQTDEDKALAEARAKAAMEYLVQKGVDRNRVRAEFTPSESSTVAFILGELPY